MAKLKAKPEQPEQSLITQTLSKCSTSRDEALKCTDPVEVQKHINDVIKTLKDLAELQSAIGKYRKEMGLHSQSLRKARPKGRPQQGDRREINGKTYVYFDGIYNEIAVVPN